MTQFNFDEPVLISEFPVLVDDWDERCAPCKAMAAVLGNIRRSAAGGESERGTETADRTPVGGRRYKLEKIQNIFSFDLLS